MVRVSRGFRGKRVDQRDESRLPPGQYLVDDFPVLSAGPTPYTSLEEWTFSITGGAAESKTWSWAEFKALPSEDIRTDIHCV
jgi:DMSO/TMAO reductase YedYZ molybdopterin-dependent catalytic subunit